MKNLVLIASILTSVSYAHKLPPAVQKIVDEALSLEASVKNGKSTYRNKCMGCHGEKGMPRNLQKSIFPYLADQTPKYLLIHMAMYQTEHRINPMMNSVAKSLSTQDMANIKSYLVSEEARAAHCENIEEEVNAVGGNIERGRLLAHKKRDFTRNDGSVVGISCTMCHGDNGLMPEEYRNRTMHPDLAGQGAKYLLKQFLAFKVGERVNAGPMNLMVRDLSKRDLKDLSSYYGSLGRCR